MFETSKSMTRRFYDYRYFTRYFVGDGIDIGSGNDGLSNFMYFMPMVKSIKDWDKNDGDAQFMEGDDDETYNFVHSSHCLEHMNDPKEALKNWFRILKKGGFMVVTVPDSDLYEQGVWPSNKNSDHKWMFTLNGVFGISDIHNLYNISDLLFLCFEDKAKIIKTELLDAGYRYSLNHVDQTLGITSESAIEFIIQKL
jgi:ubiquinone/menaquinone biosynthesis C-methylase UbiE